MENVDIIRAWKDEAYRQSLSPETLAQLPENPAGLIELTDVDLGFAVGGVSQLEGQVCESPSPSAQCWTATCTSQPNPWACAG